MAMIAALEEPAVGEEDARGPSVRQRRGNRKRGCRAGSKKQDKKAKRDPEASAPVRKPLLGIIGGSGPEAGVDVFEKVMAAHRARLGAAYGGDRDAPDVTLFNVSAIGGPRAAADVAPGADARAKAWGALRRAVERALAHGCDFFCVACNTLHVFASDVRDLCARLGKPDAFVSIVDAVAAALPAGNAALLGGPATTGPHSPYARVAASWTKLDENDEATLRDVIWAVKRAGPTAEARAAFAALVAALKARGADACVLACTELPLVADPTDDSLLDASRLVAAALLDAGAR